MTACAWAPVLPDRRETRNSAFEQTDYRRGQERGNQVDVQPRKPAAYTDPGRGEGAFFARAADHLLQVGDRILLSSVEQTRLPDDAYDTALEVHDRQARQLILIEKLDDFFSRSHGFDEHRARAFQLTERLVWQSADDVL